MDETITRRTGTTRRELIVGSAALAGVACLPARETAIAAPDPPSTLAASPPTKKDAP